MSDEELRKEPQDELEQILSKMAFKCAGGITHSGRKECTAAKQQILDWHNKKVNEAYTAQNQGATCCKDKHQTFYGAVTSSPQWHHWRELQSKKPTRDMAEVEELGVMSDSHFQEFIAFCLALKEKGVSDEENL